MRNGFSHRASEEIDFNAVNRVALAHLPSLLFRWLPDGRQVGQEWVARNPRRDDKRPGSFRVNLVTGKWADFATSDAGGDVVSLAAFLAGSSQVDAARSLKAMMGAG